MLYLSLKWYFAYPTLNVPRNIRGQKNDYFPREVVKPFNESECNTIALLAVSIMESSDNVLYATPVQLLPTKSLDSAARQHWAVYVDFKDREPALLRVASFFCGSSTE